MTCPFCKNDLLAGATVCGHCRAYATAERTGFAGLLLAIGFLMLTMVPITGLIFDMARSKWIFWTILGVPLVLIGSTIPKHTVWYVRH